MVSSGYLKVILAMLIWGSVGIFVRIAEQPAPTIVFFRVATAFVAIGVYFLLKRKSLNLNGYKKLAVISGIAIALNWLFFFKAIQTTTIGNAVLTYYLSPILAIIWAKLFLGEHLERRALYAVGMAASGIFLMLSSYQFSLSSSDFIGILFGLTAALFYSAVVILVKYMTAVDTNSLVIVQMGVSSVIFLPFIILNPPTLTFSSVLAMLTMGIVHSAIALGIYFTGLKTVKIQHASVLSYVDPVSSLIFAYLIFGETPTLFTAVGGAMILAASFLVMKRI
ncbi:DMT family transporter [Dendrosporobacter sp. 1207_IL3150]|uniref:DMT family transporter n=1 Tax=Dendrosporobacter sp. 1207_IL3150 TaxID=3084054 RepID=UPI002FDA78B5